jgi:secreted trypsin-like serine protease
MRNKMFWTVLSVFAVLALVVSPAKAITGTWVEDFEHPYVGLIAFYDSSGEFIWRCTGSLISETEFLTAGHCTDNEGGAGAVTARVWFQQDAGANFNGVVDPYTGYPDYCAAGTEGTLCATSDELYNYGFANFAGFPNTHDVGMVILDQPIAMPEYGVLASAGYLDSLGLETKRGLKDTIFTVSGYGLTYRTNDKDALPNISYRSRLMGVSTLINLHNSYTDGFNIQTQGNGNERGGTCSGDSGGPVFYGNTESNLIVAVTSFGLNSLCRGPDYSYRIDRKEVLDWLADPSNP